MRQAARCKGRFREAVEMTGLGVARHRGIKSLDADGGASAPNYTRPLTGSKAPVTPLA